MFLNYLLLIVPIAIAIMTTTQYLTTEQTELIPVRADDREVKVQKTN